MGRLSSVPGALRPSRRQLVRTAISVLPLLLFIPHALGIWPVELLTRVENYFYDLRVRLTLQEGVDPRVVIIDIDELSQAEQGRWPWPRDRLASLVDRLFDDYGARVVGFDVMFPEPESPLALRLIDELLDDSDLPQRQRTALSERRAAYETDRLFAESLIARDVVLGYVFKHRLTPGEPAALNVLPAPMDLDGGSVADVDWVRPAGYTGNLAMLQESAAGGFFDTPLVDSDGTVRRMPVLQMYEGRLYESLALVVARLALGSPPVQLQFVATDDGAGRRLDAVVLGRGLGHGRIPVDARGAALIPFRGPVGSFPYVPATRVLKGEADPRLLRDAIVLVGTSAPGLLDIRPTPVDREYIGVEAHANMVAGILDDVIPFVPPYARQVEVIGLLVLALIGAFWLGRLSPQGGLILVAALIAAWVGAGVWLWSHSGAALPMASLVAYILIAALLQFSYSYFVEIRRKRRIMGIFSQYVPGEVVRKLEPDDARLTLEGQSREMSVLFSDVRGFTTISEGLEPRELTRLMNEFLTPITGIIQRHRGTIDKYMGDAVMAFWGAPLPDPRHARHAVHAALAMIDAMRALQPVFESRGWPQISIGVGISTGVMSVGDMGSQFRVAYTVLGDTVNLGSRLEGLTKQYGVDIIVSGPTAAAVDDVVFRELDRVRVKGKHEPVAILQPVGPRGQVAQAELESVAAFAAMLEHYRAQRWHEALEVLDTLVRTDGHSSARSLYTLYLERIARCRAFPPPADWDGVFVFETK
jgi:adenylate cyclase